GKSERMRTQEQRDACRELVVSDMLQEFRRDPKNKGKTEDQLLALVYEKEDVLDKKTDEKVKKIKDAANAVFQALDGWGDDTKAIKKTLVGLTPEESALMNIEYRRHFGMDLD